MLYDIIFWFQIILGVNFHGVKEEENPEEFMNQTDYPEHWKKNKHISLAKEG